MNRGKVFVLEGGEGAGKSTQVRKLQSSFPGSIITREPGGTEYAEQIRSLIFKGDTASAETLFFLFWAARMEHMQKLILPALAGDKIVFIDRFDLSTFAYQLRGHFDTRELDSLFWDIRRSMIVQKMGRHNLHYIYLDIDVETSINRLKGRGGEVTHFDTLPRDFHERVRTGGHEFMRKIDGGASDPYKVCHLIDATRPVDDVQQDIASVIERVLAA